MGHLLNEVFQNNCPYVSPPRVSTVESHAEETCSLDIHVNKSNINTHIMNFETPLTSVPESKTVISPEVFPIKSNTKEIMNLNIHKPPSPPSSGIGGIGDFFFSFNMKTFTAGPRSGIKGIPIPIPIPTFLFGDSPSPIKLGIPLSERVRISGSPSCMGLFAIPIPEHTSTVDSNVNIGVTSTIDTSIILLPPATPLITYVVQITSIPTHSSTFVRILCHLITTLFLSQSTGPSHHQVMDDSQLMDDEDDLILGRLDDNIKSFKFDIFKVQNVARERHELLEKQLSTLKESIELKIQGLYDLISSKFKNTRDFCYGVRLNVDRLISTVNTLLEDVQAFNVEYKAKIEKKMCLVLLFSEALRLLSILFKHKSRTMKIFHLL
ncbi:unnamed protein product [Lactuca saligna]|uniref:Uncharacterized protein n=1 Tax=Lactuca saligna TaxID=75948 RepID=A0AA36ECG1_LACSI|nr:unnamed protein product [Lactuca saligna]